MTKRAVLNQINKNLTFRFKVCDGLFGSYQPKELRWSLARKIPAEQAQILRESSSLFEPFAKRWDFINDRIQDIEKVDDEGLSETAIIDKVVETLYIPASNTRYYGSRFQSLPESGEEGKRVIEWEVDAPTTEDDVFPQIKEYVLWLDSNDLYDEETVEQSVKEFLRLKEQPITSIGTAFSSTDVSKSAAALKLLEAYLSGELSEWPKLEEIVRPLSERIATLRDVVQKVEVDAENRFKELSLRQDERESEAEGWVKEKEERIANLEKAFKEKLRLEAPEELWRDRAKKQRRFALIYGLIATVLAIALIGVMSWAVPTFVMSIPNDSIITPLFLIAAIVTFAVYVIRVFIKMGLSAMHLSQTYEQKEALTHFLQTLLADGGDISADERLIIYGELFSSVDTGLVKTNDGGEIRQVIDTAMKRA
ncbi:MAG: hypothetical protein IJ131_01270 [Eggerthellaceae bacterium]|nr:hypothetical protein [Eggerthellaceae bacterium]